MVASLAMATSYLVYAVRVSTRRVLAWWVMMDACQTLKHP
ncbi:hypothetical protein ARTHRO9V_150037 [Arthrobacter sp. 9V]|nr:hypothetical protein ARTHRO9V_150037 [Arthrobacter sp. 9V]